MRITIVQGAFLPVPPLRGGAVEKVWCALGAEFARRDHAVTHVSRRFEGLPDEERRDGVHHLRVQGYDTPRSLVRLKLLDLFYSLRVLRVLPPADILVTNTFWLPILVRSERFGRLYVHVARQPRGQMRFYRHAARLQGVSQSVTSAIIERVPNITEKVKCVPYPLPNRPALPNSGEPRKKRLLYAGRVHPEKGIHLLVEAVVRLHTVLSPEWRLQIVGPWDTEAGGGGEAYLRDLQRMAEGAPGRVEFIGPVYDPVELAAFYREASLFVYPSLAEKGETFGVAPLEAMSHGCPALVSNLPCFRDFIEEGTNGFVFDHRGSGASPALEQGLRRLLGDPGGLQAAGCSAYQSAAQFSLERVAGLYLGDFDAVCQQGR